MWTQDFFITCGLLTTTLTATLLLRRTNPAPSAAHLTTLLLAGGLVAVSGARALWWSARWLSQGHRPALDSLWSPSSGFASLGAVLATGAVFFALDTTRAAHTLHIRARIYPLMCAALWGLGVARLGCRAQGCDFGRVLSPGDLFYGIAHRYHSADATAWLFFSLNGDLAPTGHTPALFPFALCLSVLALSCALVATLSCALDRSPRQVIPAAWGVYIIGRLGLESLRHPSTAPHWTWFNLNQVLCAVILTGLIALVLRDQKRYAERIMTP